MHATVLSKPLSDALRTLKRSAPNTIAVRVVAGDAGLTLSAGDYDVMVDLVLPADVKEQGSTLVSRTDLIAAAKAPAGAPIELRVEGNVLRVVGDLTHDLSVLDVDPRDYKPQGPKRDTFDLDVETLTSPLKANSLDPMRPILTGVLFGKDGDLVSTDSYRLHLVRNAHTAAESILVPGLALAAVHGHVKSGTVRFDVHDRDVWITSQTGCRWGLRLIDGEFPNYKQLVPHPKQQQGSITFPRPAFTKTLLAMDKITKRVEGAAVKISEVDGMLRLETQGTHTPSIADLPGAATHPMAFTPSFLADIVDGLTTCTIRTIDALKPAWVEETTDAGVTHLRLIMPVRIH